MSRTHVYWKTPSGTQEIPIEFVKGDELPWWGLGEMLNKVVHEKARITEALQYVGSLTVPIMHVKDAERMGDSYMVPQMELGEALESLVDARMIPRGAADQIYAYLEQVPTPQMEKAESSPEAKKRKRKGKEEEESEGEDGGEPYFPKQRELQEEEEEEDSSEAPHAVDGATTAQLPACFEQDDDQDRALIDRVMVATRLIDSIHPLTRNKDDLSVFATEREREDAALFLRNVMRALPRQQILNYLTGEQGDEEDDSPVVTVGQRVAQLGYTIQAASSYEGRRLRMDIGLLATRYYRELHEEREPPQIYRILHGGARVLVNKWTLNNCYGTLDRAIHTLLQK